MKEKTIKNLEKFAISNMNMSSVKGGNDNRPVPIFGGGSRPIRPMSSIIITTLTMP